MDFCYAGIVLPLESYCPICSKYLRRCFYSRICYCPPSLKPGKASGPDFICPEHVIHVGSGLEVLFFCLRQLKISKFWRRALVVAIPKPSKPVEDPQSYRPIPLLCVPYKILKRMSHNRVKSIVDPLLTKRQARFRHGKSTVDQVVLVAKTLRILRQNSGPVPCC